MTASQTRIGSIVDNFYGDSSDAAIAANAYKRAVEELDGITGTQYVSILVNPAYLQTLTREPCDHRIYPTGQLYSSLWGSSAPISPR